MKHKIPALQLLIDKNKNYFTNHSLLCSYISAALATQMGWGSDITFSKLAFASLFHDISLTEVELEYANMNISEVNFEDMTTAQAQQFQSHPERSVEILSKIPGVPLDVDQIVLYHHKAPDNSGYPNHLHSSRMIPLATLFIIAHDMSDFFIEHTDYGNENLILNKFLKEREEKYQTGNFKKIFISIAQNTKTDSKLDKTTL